MKQSLHHHDILHLQSWALTLRANDYTTAYKPGAHNYNAGLFSQLPLPEAQPGVASLHLWEWPAHPWERIHIDYTDPVLWKMLLMVVDTHSKWLEVEIVPSAHLPTLSASFGPCLPLMAFHNS